MDCWFAEAATSHIVRLSGEATSRVECDVDSLLRNVVKRMPFINTFFDRVLVIAEDQAMRENRLGLLQRIAGSQT